MSKSYTSKSQELDLGRREEGLTGSWDEARWPGGGSHGAVVEIEPARSGRRAAVALDQAQAAGRRGGGGSPRIYGNSL